jgi:hypothetical protein
MDMNIGVNNNFIGLDFTTFCEAHVYVTKDEQKLAEHMNNDTKLGLAAVMHVSLLAVAEKLSPAETSTQIDTLMLLIEETPLVVASFIAVSYLTKEHKELFESKIREIIPTERIACPAYVEILKSIDLSRENKNNILNACGPLGSRKIRPIV